MEQVREGVSGNGLEGDFREQKLQSYIQSRLKYLNRRCVYNLLWQLIPVQDYSNAECMLVNLESMIGAGVGSKKCVAWKTEKAVDYFVHTDKITADSSTN